MKLGPGADSQSQELSQTQNVGETDQSALISHEMARPDFFLESVHTPVCFRGEPLFVEEDAVGHDVGSIA